MLLDCDFATATADLLLLLLKKRSLALSLSLSLSLSQLPLCPQSRGEEEQISDISEGEGSKNSKNKGAKHNP